MTTDLSEESTIKLGFVFKLISIILGVINTLLILVCTWVVVTVSDLETRVTVIESNRFTPEDAHTLTLTLTDQLNNMDKRQEIRFDRLERAILEDGN